MSKKSSPGAFFSGLMIGGAIGTVVGLLVAPRTGKETRKVIKKSANALPELAEDLTTSIQLQADRLSESTWENWEDTLERLKLAIATGIETSRATTRATKLDTNRDLNSTVTDRL
ncbi:gas vesicle protein [Pleurocapsa sp. CCALA 161]|uniref:YtxH domain-containing protein n=1 Tax=Pleurocapsa sp. CCALA 161 TaxID=2107688 RepID=UPI000D04CBC7|nr:YtxH domain-containing protein [Pleurocapsa sp. CCALA 161]PSB10971.1 gas vesicle protein [Pleurocapsa sp. CCALA 161]